MDDAKRKKKFEAKQRERSKEDLHRLRQKEKRSRIEKQIEARSRDEWQKAREKQDQSRDDKSAPLPDLQSSSPE